MITIYAFNAMKTSDLMQSSYFLQEKMAGNMSGTEKINILEYYFVAKLVFCFQNNISISP